MHILAGLDQPTAGEVTVAGVDIGGLDDTELTKLRRDHIGFIFQFFNLLPMLTAAENIALPLKLAGGKPDPAWLDELVADRRPRPTASRTARPSSPAASSSASPSPARSSRARASCSPTSRRATSTRRPAARSSALLRDSVDKLGQTTVMVTHDAHAAAIADRVLFLADGDIVRDLGPSTRARDPRDARAGERTMIGVALKGLAARKVRALLTALAVVIGVSMVSGTFILTDTMQKSFNGLFTASSAKTDAVISGKEIVKNSTSGSGITIPAALLDQGPGAARGRGRRRRRQPRRGQRRRHHRQGRQGRRQGERRRELRRRQRPLQPARASRPASRPQGPGEVAIDAGTAAKQHYKVGDSVVVSTLGKQAHATAISGTVSFGSVDSLGFASIAAWDVPTAQTLLHREGRFDSISVAAKHGHLAGSSSCEAIKPLLPGQPAGQGQRQAGQGRREGPQRRHGDDPRRCCSASAASRCSSARS